MPSTMRDFRRDFAKQYLHELTPEERLEGLSPEEWLKRLPLKEIEDYVKQCREASPPSSGSAGADR